MSRVMVIAGGAWQVPLIEKLHEMGHYVLCTNLYDYTPGMKIADEREVADVLDKERNLCIAQEYKPDLVITDQSDIAVPTVAFISEKLGLPGIGCKIAKLYTNKFCMREFEKENNFLHPQYQLCESYNKAKSFVQKYGKSILKPINSQASRGIYTVENAEIDFCAEFEAAQKYSIGDNSVLIETYMEGTEFTVDGIKLGDEYRVLAISEKKHYKHNNNIASELYFCDTNNLYDYTELKAINEKFVKKTGLPFGLTHAEYMYTKGEFVMIEIAARGGGTRISSDIVPVISGIDSVGLLVRYALGEAVQIPQKSVQKGCAVLKFLDVPEGKVQNIAGIDAVRKMKNVIDVQIKFEVNDIIKKPDNDSLRKGFYIAYAQTEKELEGICNKVEQTLEIEVEEMNA